MGKGLALPKARLRLSTRPARSRIRRTVAAGTAAAALAGVASLAACTPPNQPSSTDLYRLRMCESGGNYAINTGNGYYGAYQFAAGTWQALGYPGVPSQAAPVVQDAAVVKLWQMRGWAPWPGCAASLGLR